MQNDNKREYREAIESAYSGALAGFLGGGVAAIFIMTFMPFFIGVPLSLIFTIGVFGYQLGKAWKTCLATLYALIAEYEGQED